MQTPSQDQVAPPNASTYPQPPPHVRQDVGWILSTFISMIHAKLLTPTQTSPERTVSRDRIVPQLVSPVLSRNPVVQTGVNMAYHACPNCKRNFDRAQELKRHLRSNLPHWIHCPIHQCPWTGNRRYDLKDHMTAHANIYRGEPKPEEYQIYDPEELVEAVVRDTLSVVSAADIALSMVGKRFAQPDKAGVEANVWSRRRKFCKRVDFDPP